jgi:NADH:ubiquinone oxidoreductase subunit 5 (subunit L)/multisubunit Na+/H+ antiporter MnhA subunit
LRDSARLTAGFIAKWMLLQAALLGAATQPLLAVFALVVVIGSILALAYAMKYVGAAYLGAPADPRCCAETGEVPFTMRLPQTALVLGLIAAGLWPVLMAGPATAAWGQAVGIVPSMAALDSGMLLVSGAGGGLVGGFVPPVVFALMAAAGLLALGLSRIAGAPTREVPTWQSGLDIPQARTRLPASGWYWPFTPVLRSVYREIKLPFLAKLSEAAERSAESERATARATAGSFTLMDGGE